jgi:8-oxo-dGTP pyrophosphatase MutT (NUDIX family)
MESTWDGLPIAADWPRGATVVVRRTDGDVLLLHRAHHGADFAGPWGWTTPAGSRQPGESILGATLRELAEEASISGVDVMPIDLTGSWALFAAEVGHDTRIRLTDIEHDRYEWVTPEDAYARIKPDFVAGGVRRALAVPTAPIEFVPLERTDLLNLVEWQNAPHVRAWWTDAVGDVDEAAKKYGPRIDGESETAIDAVIVAGRPVGFVECTPLAADEEYFETACWATDGGADTVAIDYAIADASLVGRGVGTRLLWSYIREIVLSRFPDTRYVAADPDVANVASVRACEKAGFRRAHDFRPDAGGPRYALCVFDRARVLGTT